MKKWILGLVVVLEIMCCGNTSAASDINASTDVGCPSFQFVFARGSGQERNNGDDWRAFSENAKRLVKRRGFTYKIMDLEYPAVSVSAPNLTGVGAFISAGKSFKFGRSVQTGVGSLAAYRSMVQMNCPDTRWILMGYSQGAMVIAQALKYFKAGELVYAGMFGDPELYLPEGRGAWPAACRGKNLSPYRVFVPNCHADNGSLGTRNPYEIDRFRGKYGLWCNNGDFVCGSSKNLFNNGGHVEYRNGAYSQAFAIVDKILTTNRVSTNYARLMRGASSEIYAYARQTEYFVAPGEEIEIDLTPSISIEHEVSEYLWSFDGETWMANDAVILRSFEAGEYKILAKVSDGFNESDVLEILVHVGDFAGPVTLPAPTTLKLLRQDDNIWLYWRAVPDGAKYAFIKVNGLGLDYVDVSAGETRISDVEYDDLRDIEVAWMDVDGNVGEFATIDMANFGSEIMLGDWSETLPKESDDNVDVEPPKEEIVETGVTFGAIGLFVVIIVILIGIKIAGSSYKKSP